MLNYYVVVFYNASRTLDYICDAFAQLYYMHIEYVQAQNLFISSIYNIELNPTTLYYFTQRCRRHLFVVQRELDIIDSKE